MIVNPKSGVLITMLSLAEISEKKTGKKTRVFREILKLEMRTPSLGFLGFLNDLAVIKLKFQMQTLYPSN